MVPLDRMDADLREFVRSLQRRLRKVPSAYTLGSVLFAVALLLLLASLHSELGVVGTGVAVGEVAPGISEREVPFRVTPMFRASLVVAVCGVDFHLLNDSEYTTYAQDGSLPVATLDCNRTEAIVHDRVGRMVTVFGATPGTPNVTFGISVAFIGTRTPYAILSVPGAGIGLAVTIWVSMTMMARGTDRLAERAREVDAKRKQKRMKK